ncbi:hypothetical protein [Chitinibacter sp. GC72]|uniref:hypothetical protein n=1 Tax=Chitinibacter sp. GC72 TaxID=1526917 RepID=UPI001E30F5FC|nr:hypothetical protein [Chitinibacter sp. GC72]
MPWTPQWLNAAKAKIETFLAERLAARINPSKTILQPIARGIDFVGQIIKPHHRITRRRTVATALRRCATVPANELFETANSYFGLLRTASHNHADRCKLANILRRRGHTINGDINKAYQKSK